MILTGKILVRVVLVVVLGVILQLSFFSQVALFHTSPDVLPALVVCFGLLGGTMSGAVAGFSVGLLLDCLLIAPLGGGSLVLLTTGYLAGLFRERFEIHSPLVPPLLCMGFTLFAELGFGAVELMLGLNDAAVSTLVVRDLLLKSIFAFFLGWGIYALLRRLLRPALVEEPTTVSRRGQRPLRPGRGRRPRAMGA
jgi:rod shape-determining protein MreD